MADIKQAARWLREGKKVRISTWNKTSYVGLQSGSRELLALFDTRNLARTELEYVPAVADFESDQWEEFVWVN